MLKIVQVIPALAWGGAEMFCVQLSNQLAENPQNKMTLISMYNHSENLLPLSLIHKNVEFIELGKKKGPDLKIISRLYKTIKKIQPDVVHTHMYTGYYCMLPYLIFKKNQFKKIHTLHNLAAKESPKWIMRRIYKIFFQKKIIHPVSISKEVLKSAVEEYGNVARTLINNGSEKVKPSVEFQSAFNIIHQYKKNEQTKVLINIARITPQKNQQLLVDCMRTLEQENENAVALVFGDCVEENKNLYDQLLKNKPSNIFFLGTVNNIGDYLLNADAFVLTSIFEGLPISLLEAMSAGVVPVCTPVGGIVDVVKKDNGFLSEDVSYESYLKALKQFMHSDEETIKKLQENNKQIFLSEFSIEKCAGDYYQLYQSELN